MADKSESEAIRQIAAGPVYVGLFGHAGMGKTTTRLLLYMKLVNKGLMVGATSMLTPIYNLMKNVYGVPIDDAMSESYDKVDRLFVPWAMPDNPVTDSEVVPRMADALTSHGADWMFGVRGLEEAIGVDALKKLVQDMDAMMVEDSLLNHYMSYALLAQLININLWQSNQSIVATLAGLYMDAQNIDVANDVVIVDDVQDELEVRMLANRHHTKVFVAWVDRELSPYEEGKRRMFAQCGGNRSFRMCSTCIHANLICQMPIPPENTVKLQTSCGIDTLVGMVASEVASRTTERAPESKQ